MSLPVNSKFTKIDKNVKYALECSECLVFKPSEEDINGIEIRVKIVNSLHQSAA